MGPGMVTMAGGGWITTSEGGIWVTQPKLAPWRIPRLPAEAAPPPPYPRSPEPTPQEPRPILGTEAQEGMAQEGGQGGRQIGGQQDMFDGRSEPGEDGEKHVN